MEAKTLFEEYIDTKRHLEVIEASISEQCRKWVDANADKLLSLEAGISRVEYVWNWHYATIKGEFGIVKIEYYAYRGNVAIPKTIKVNIKEVLSI